MIMNWQNKIAEQVSSIPRSGIREFFDLVTGRTDIISLGVGEPDFVTPWNIREAAIYSLEKGHTSYTSNYGLESLRRSIVKYVDGFFHVNYDPLREVLVTVGVSEAIDLALRAILNPGDEVLYHEPCYVSYAPSVNMAYGVATAVPTSKRDLFRPEPGGAGSVHYTADQGADAQLPDESDRSGGPCGNPSGNCPHLHQARPHRADG